MGEVTAFLQGLPDDQAAALRRIVDLALEVAPEAEEGRSYGMPALRLDGRPLLGMVAAKGHLSVFPFSPEAIVAVSDRLAGWSLSTGTIRFTSETPLPEDAVRDLVRARRAEITAEPRRPQHAPG